MSGIADPTEMSDSLKSWVWVLVGDPVAGDGERRALVFRKKLGDRAGEIRRCSGLEGFESGPVTSSATGFFTSTRKIRRHRPKESAAATSPTIPNSCTASSIPGSRPCRGAAFNVCQGRATRLLSPWPVPYIAGSRSISASSKCCPHHARAGPSSDHVAISKASHSCLGRAVGSADARSPIVPLRLSDSFVETSR